MPVPEQRRYSIREVSELIGVPQHVLRQWEAKIPQLKPRRTRANRRYYLDADIAVARRLKHLVRDERLTLAGARKRLAQEQHGEGPPRLQRDALDLIDQISAAARELEHLLDTV